MVAERSIGHGASSDGHGLQPAMRNLSFGTSGQQSFSIYSQGLDPALPFPSASYPPGGPPPTSWQGIADGMGDPYPQQQREASTSAPSLHTSSAGHLAASTSSGHGILVTRPTQAGGRRRPTSVQSFISRLRPGSRGSQPEIVIHGASSKSSSRESVASYRRNPPPPLVGIPLLNQSNRPPLEPILSGGLWVPATTLPPSPTATENSRMFEDLLTPNLGARAGIATSEHSSAASLRDHVDYSRPISGLVRNRVHSTMTYQTEDTITDGKDSPTVQ
ncbi:hypothetical protein H0H81_002446 [Sphagnurus paluster]|uniref:Uncharacterized protein n=1 Tax=Sphagnurus paluster TaxID=117069 RepID=A0A9P7KHT5_9AGAR|nr:hypothetical protein H0H81_002446 [Sphagnurus paluster]